MKLSNYPNITFKSSAIHYGNMSTVHEDPNKVVEHREKFFRKHKLSLTNAVNMFVEHSNKVVIVDRSDSQKGVFEDEDGIMSDALCTNQKDLILMLVTGDCLPIGISDTKKRAIALLHGSRKSLQKGVLEATVETLSKNFESNPKDLIVEIGPSIGPCCYNFDLWTLTEKKLRTLGVLKKNIHNQKLCTYHSGNYFSHRKYVVEHLSNDFRIMTVLGMV